MIEWWNALDLVQQILWVMAVPSTLILLLQIVLMCIGLGQGDGDLDVDADTDTDFDVPDADLDGDGLPDDGFAAEGHGEGLADHADGLRMLSVRGIIAFFAVGSWCGLAATELGAPPALAVGVALLCGFGALVLVAVLMRAMNRLQQSGNLDLHNAVGKQAQVYVRIPENGHGKVTLVFQERFEECDAVSSAAPLAAGTAVTVVGLADEHTLLVEPVE